jgi:dipeptidyl aminopeptidase/acylaminoacyl peptidase
MPPLAAPHSRITAGFAALLLALAFAPAPAAGQDAEAGYRLPNPLLAAMIDAPPTPGVSPSPDLGWLLLLESPGLPSIEEVAAPELRLAGLRINPRSNGPSRQRSLSGLRLQRLAAAGEAAALPITGLPAGARLSYASWSPDSKRVACVVEGEAGLSLWSAALEDGKARRLGPADLALNAVYGQPYRWLPDGSGFIVAAVPAKRGAAPSAPLAPAGPVVMENLGGKKPARTYQDLLQNGHDELLFDHYARAQLWQVDLKGKAKRLGEAGILRDVAPSPDGRYLLIEQVGRPYSYSLPEGDFPHRIEVWDREGRRVALLADLPLADAVPIAFGSVPTGRRSFSWRADAPATLCWAEALDGGDAGIEAAERDRVFTLAAPFTGDPVALITLPGRYAGVDWGSDSLALVSSRWWKTRNAQTWRLAPGNPDAAPQLMHDRSWQDSYSDPGQPVLRPGPYGRDVILTDAGGAAIYLIGEGASPEGDRPFLDRLELASGKTTRLFHSEAPHYESPVTLLDAAGQRLLTRRESRTEPPNYFLRDLGAGSLAAVTAFPDPTPQLAGIQKELIQYQRADGVGLTGTLYTPAGFRPGVDAPLPTIVWAYPREFKSAADAGQVSGSPHRFTRVGWWSPALFLVRGYAVLDDAAMPIVGEGETEPNDSFIAQLVASAQAALDELVRRGVADRERLAVGGHSYGAFMAANLLAHSDLFRLGLARSGAYNRTLTPFGFQGEERSLWEAPAVYAAMSPFMHADKIDEPILLAHGEADNNPGTYTMQSERLYEAIKGMGGTARLVLLPHESHSYRARESVMHLIWETDTWLERYVKNAPPREQAAR